MKLDIYELLEKLRQRPAMYLGNTSDCSFMCLQSFLRGLYLSNNYKNEIEFHSFLEFGRWVPARLGNRSTMPFHQMLEDLGNDKAFEKYFELLDEFNSCKDLYLEKAIILKSHKANFYTIPPDDIYGSVEPEKPLMVCVAHYSPSNVYYLAEIYPNHTKKNPHYQNSADAVKLYAKETWSISEDEWLEI